MVSFMRRATRHIARQHRRRRELRELLGKDDRILRDIGLTRAEVERALHQYRPMSARGGFFLSAPRFSAMSPPY